MIMNDLVRVEGKVESYHSCLLEQKVQEVWLLTETFSNKRICCLHYFYFSFTLMIENF